MDRRLLLAEGVVFTCQHSGACCRADWRVPVDPASRERLRDVDWSALVPAPPAGSWLVPSPDGMPGDARVEPARRPGGACVFLTADTRCAIHVLLGAAAKPQACRQFPYQFVATPDGVAVGVSYACTAVRAGQGRPLAEQRGEILDVLRTSPDVCRVPDPVPLFGTLDMTWAEYRLLEAALLELLGDETVPLATALVAGSALVGAAVALAGVQRRARVEGGGPTAALADGLARLRGSGYRSLVEAAAAARPPRRGAAAPLALLYTWLEVSRRRPSRLGLLAALYRNLFRFRRSRGPVPDLVGDRGVIVLEDVARVRLDLARGELDRFLRGYWRHVIFRKTLLPMHGVFRGYQTLLLLHAFTRWAARAQAHERGATEVIAEDLREAVRLVEQHFVLHARLADLFAVSPLLTLMADRLFRRPFFVRACAL